MRRLHAVAVKTLKDLHIKEMSFGCPELPTLSSYGAYMIKADEGDYVLFNSHNEVCLSELVPFTKD